MKDLHILVVEDDHDWQEELKLILQRLGDNVLVDVASSYEDAINFIEEKSYELIIVDLYLSLNDDPPTTQSPDMLGMRLLQVVRESQYNKNGGLIVLTGHASIPSTKEAFRDYDVNDFVEKDDFDSGRFLKIVRAAILSARLTMAAAKAYLRLTVTFTQEHLTDCELSGLGLRSGYHAPDPQRFDVAELSRRADNLNLLVLEGGPEIWRPETKGIGRTIYEALSKEQRIQSDLIAAQAHVQNSKDLWLQFSGPALGLGVPFELLHNGDDYLGYTHILSRRVVQAGPTMWRKTDPFHTFIAGLVKHKKKLRILLVGANSDGNIPGAEREAAALKTDIETDLAQLGIAREVTLLSGAEATYANVSKALRTGGYHIFHYAGHGRYDDTLPEVSGLVLRDGSTLRTLRAADLTMLVRNPDVQLIFLSCCLGARNAAQKGRGDFHGMLEAVVSADVPIVIGYRWTVDDASALSLAQVFYESLWRTFSPGEALLEARIQATMGPQGRDDETWASPVLVQQNM